jgi:hypothetical protein
MSVSRMPVESPSRALARAMLVAIVLFPTPPLALLTAMTLVTFAMGRFSGRPLFMRAARFGGVPERGRPYYMISLALIMITSTPYWTFMSCSPQVNEPSILSTMRLNHLPMGSHGHRVCLCWKSFVSIGTSRIVRTAQWQAD